MLTTKMLPWIGLESGVSAGIDPSIDECVKFVQWKLEDYKLSDSDKRIMNLACSMNLNNLGL